MNKREFLVFAPLAFGTLKAAFYAMLMATPLAICGAIYTAYFMAPAMRRKREELVRSALRLSTVRVPHAPLPAPRRWRGGHQARASRAQAARRCPVQRQARRTRGR